MDLAEKSQRSRDRILSRIRASYGRSEGPGAAERRQADAYLQRHAVGPKPPISDADKIPRFIAQSARLSATIDRAQRRSQIPELINRYCWHHGLSPRAVAWPAFRDLDWAAHGLDVEFRAPVRDEPVPDLIGITGCFAAVAETGTLAMLSGPETPASMTLLPETHIAVIPQDRVFHHMEDVFERLRAERGLMPRALNFISGPSRTADIEQTLVLGAHGPYRVHLILLESSS
ncbi:MAG: hypothetical protein RLZZ290_191 [Pseudomonadota bacterium]|jgi:L-lactate dehydrogenase complex protein LldG